MVLLRQFHSGGQGVDALHHHADLLHGLLRAFALADQDTGAVVAAVHTGGGNDQVADTGQTRKGLDIAAHGHAQPGDLGNAAGDQGGAGVIAVAKAGGDANAQRDNVLHGTAQFHTLDIRVGVHAHTGVAEHLLHHLGSFHIRAGRNDGGGQIQRHLLGVGGAAERHQTHRTGAVLVAQLVGKDLGHGI